MEDEDFNGLYLDLMKEFLATATPMQWLAVVTTMNYDNGSALADWISKYPKLEPAVAKALYWYQQPGYFQHYESQDKVPSINRKGWARVQALSQRFADGNLAPATIGWDPANDLASPTGKESIPAMTGPVRPSRAAMPCGPFPPSCLKPCPERSPISTLMSTSKAGKMACRPMCRTSSMPPWMGKRKIRKIRLKVRFWYL